ncbi:hypothetical protein DFH29DRAFT_1052764, partial [Suillus ampliporus]
MPFNCPLCPSHTQATLTELEAHIKKTHVTRTTCELCQQDFKNNTALVQHLASKKHRKCKKCSKSFMTPTELSKHTELRHNAGSEVPSSSKAIPVTFPAAPCGTELSSQTVPKVQAKVSFGCSMCNKRFSSTAGLSSHIKAVHNPKAPVKQCYPCASCNQIFSKKSKQAPRPVSPPTSYPCSLCNNDFELRSALDDHMTAEHPFTCGMCNFTCPEEELILEHITSVHSCPVCHEGVFANADLLNEHLVDHATPYYCEVCQTRYAEEEGLRQHYRDTPDDIHPSCTQCDLGFQDAGDYYDHTETIHPQVSCQPCDGALFDPGELPMHYLTSRNHPVCDMCQVGFSDQVEFAMVGGNIVVDILTQTVVQHSATEHPEAYCHLCQWQFECPESLQNHIQHFVAHPKCMDCDLRFADADAYQYHLFVMHRPCCGEPATPQDFDPEFLDDGIVCSKECSNSTAPDRVDLTWSFSPDSDFPYAPSIPLHPSTSGYSSPLSQRVTRSSVGSRSSSRTLSPPPILSIEV